MNYKVSENISCQNVGQDVVVLDFTTGKYFNFKGLSGLLFNFYASGGSLEDSISVVSKHFNKPIDEIKQDLTLYTNTLVSQKLLSEVQRSSTSKPLSMQFDTYDVPVIEIFDDLTDQLLLDNYIEDPTQVK